MKIIQISYGKTINIGNYQSIRLEYTASVDPGDLPDKVLEDLKDILTDAENEIKLENPPKR
jgi:hypothetical protein